MSSRRKFITQSGLGVIGLFTIIPRRVLGKGYVAPSDELTKGIIGVGGMGRGHKGYEGTRLIAICDVDSNHLQRMKQICDQEVKSYTDYRELLLNGDVDIVHIATPPHWHGLMSIAAAKAGKDVWCEKPMTRTIGEGEAVVKAMEKYGTMFRINTWFRFASNFYGMRTPVTPIKKLVENRIFGWPLKITLNATTGFNWKFHHSGKLHLVPQEIPAHLDYDFWLGPAPYKPYHPHRVHGSFRGYWDYDGGGLGDMGQHYMDPAQYLLEKDHISPVYIEVDAPQQHHEAVGSWRRIEYTYADGCKIVLDGANYDKQAAFIEGPSGKLYPGLVSNIPNLPDIISSLPDSSRQVTSFTETVKSRNKFALNELNGHRSCTLVNLGKIALQLGRNLVFNPQTQRFPFDPGANALIQQAMRGGWSITDY